MKKFLLIIILFSVTQLSAQCISGNCNNGYGAQKYKDGTLYIGNWWNGVPSGKGTLVWDDGTIYVGDFVKGLYDGEGTLFSRENLYIGEFDKNAPDGSGTLFMKSGEMYVGGFQEGYMTGQGFLHHQNGTLEEALWKKGVPEGKIVQKNSQHILRK
ncbi:MAG: hypothetical protein CMD26_01480 [Flavobacteriales bacterium]|nr:hypothetical protein [Flavobacteriales bacterium]